MRTSLPLFVVHALASDWADDKVIERLNSEYSQEGV